MNLKCLFGKHDWIKVVDVYASTTPRIKEICSICGKKKKYKSKK
jgi:hypothetical protein